MQRLLDCIENFKALRKEKNLSYKDLNERFKIPVSILKKLENDEDYVLQNYPYSYFALKTILTEFGKTCQAEKPVPKLEPLKEESQSFFEKYTSVIKAVFSFSLTVLFLFVVKVFHKNPEEPIPDIDYNYIKLGLTEPLILSKTQTKPDVKLIAKGNVWISVYIDGKINIFNLKKGEEIPINFNNKVYFQTIGNADKVLLIYNGKKITFTKKVIHNLFVDATGVFKNGYNLAQGNA